MYGDRRRCNRKREPIPVKQQKCQQNENLKMHFDHAVYLVDMQRRESHKNKTIQNSCGSPCGIKRSPGGQEANTSPKTTVKASVQV